MTVPHTFQTTFAVPLSCDGCVKSVSDALYRLDGITNVEASLQDQLISVQGSVAPSAIVQAIQETGKDAILRGSGASNSAAVSILETYAESIAREAAANPDRAVRGLARMVQVHPERTLVDLTVRGVSPGTYRATIREYGNLAEGAASAGPVWRGTVATAGSGSGSGPDSGSGSGLDCGSRPDSGSYSGSGFKGFLGEVHVAQDGRGSAFADHGFQIWEVIGHALVLTRQEEREGGRLSNDEDTVVGVVARSAGVWENDKTVCSCTGKTLWEERRDEVQKGML